MSEKEFIKFIQYWNFTNQDRFWWWFYSYHSSRGVINERCYDYEMTQVVKSLSGYTFRTGPFISAVTSRSFDRNGKLVLDDIGRLPIDCELICPNLPYCEEDIGYDPLNMFVCLGDESFSQFKSITTFTIWSTASPCTYTYKSAGDFLRGALDDYIKYRRKVIKHITSEIGDNPGDCAGVFSGCRRIPMSFNMETLLSCFKDKTDLIESFLKERIHD